MGGCASLQNRPRELSDDEGLTASPYSSESEPQQLHNIDTPLHLDALPIELILPSFMKMKNVAICRLRQTCRFMDSLVEEHRLKMSYRPTIGRPISVYTKYEHKFSESGHLVFSQSTGHSDEIAHFELTENFGKKLSGIAISQLYIYPSMKTIEAIHNAISLVNNRIPFVTFKFHFYQRDKLDLLQKYAKEIAETAESLNCEGLITIIFSGYKSDNFIKALSEAKNCSRFRLELPCDNFSFEYLKQFYCYSASPSSILQNLHTATDCGNLRRISPSAGISRSSIIDLPYVVKLWDSADISENRLAFNKTPKLICLMETASTKCVIITKYSCPVEQTFIQLVDNNPSIVFACIVRNLGISSASDSQQKLFINSHANGWKDVIQRTYLENDTFRVPWYNMSMDDVRNL